MKISPVSAQPPFAAYTARAEKISQSPGKTDQVTLSDQGKQLQANARESNRSLLNSLDSFMDGAGKDGTISLEEIKAFGEKNLKTAEDILAQTLEQLGIPSESNITIRTDEQGIVRVNSNLSPQDNERLEAALNNHPDFQQAYTKASSSRDLIAAAEKHLKFAEAYAQNPKAAVASFGIGNGGSGEYILQYFQKEASLVFQNRFSLMG